MFDIHINAVSLALASLAAFLCDDFVTRLLHRRYDRQYGWTFVLSGWVTFSLPALSLIGVPVYLLLEMPLPWVLKAFFLLAFTGVLFVLGGWLQRRLLSRIFKAPPANSEGEPPSA